MICQIQRQIVVKFQVEGVHCWPSCPIEEVAYLRNPHRHVFHFKCTKAVTHNDRDIEIIQLKHRMELYMATQYMDQTMNCCDFGSMSCEALAEELASVFDLNVCECLEDNENGAVIVRTEVMG